MKIRSITVFLNPRWPLDEAALDLAGEFIAAAAPAFTAAGYAIQTARLATIPFPLLLQPHAPAGITGQDFRPLDLVEMARTIEVAAVRRGFNYVSLGPALPAFPDSYTAIPAAITATQNTFFGGMLTAPGGGVSLPAVRACAEVIWQVAPLSPDGFTNLRFAALAGVEPGAPFFPAAYHSGKQPAFALATEAADLAVAAFSGAAGLEQGRRLLVGAVEWHAGRLQEIAGDLETRFGLHFSGLDFTLAPFPEPALSFGTALERLGAPAAGLHGSLAAAAILADTLDRAAYQRVGFNGLMLPVLEDYTLAARAAEGVLSVKDLLLYSAVCGTGLDTVPLPGNATASQLAAVLLDLAALSQRLDKPLTARLMPIPGKRAGDPTDFDFAFFANSKILALDAQPLQGLLAGNETFDLHLRAHHSTRQ